MTVKEKSKRLLIIGILGCLLYVAGDFLFAATGKGQTRVTFIYGSDETLYACAPSFEAVMQRAGAKYEMIVGKGLFHCYPVFPVCKEGRDGWAMMIRTVKERTAS